MRWLVFVLLVGALGCDPAADPNAAAAVVPLERDVVVVEGELREHDLRLIRLLIAEIEPEYPLMSIKVKKSGLVEVETGVVRGPLDGGGAIYILEKSDGTWRALRKLLWVS